MDARVFVTAVLVAAAAAACDSEVRTLKGGIGGLPSLAGLAQQERAGLATRRISLGHQSVGRKIVDGMADFLAANPQIRRRVAESKEPDSMGAAGSFHARVGRNYFPIEKLNELVSISECAFPAAQIAVLKCCCVDVRPTDDLRARFEAYRRRIDALGRSRPGLTIAHFTMSLVLAGSRGEYWMKKLRLGATWRDCSVIRNRYKELLRQSYRESEPVFDVPRVESTPPDGSRRYFQHGSNTVCTMILDYTDDGDHLNVVGRRVVAEQLIIMLARLRPGQLAAGRGT